MPIWLWPMQPSATNMPPTSSFPLASFAGFVESCIFRPRFHFRFHSFYRFSGRTLLYFIHLLSALVDLSSERDDGAVERMVTVFCMWDWNPNLTKSCLFLWSVTDVTPQGSDLEIVYCTISFNLAPSVTRYQLAEILISAGPRFERDIQIFSAGRV